MNYMTESELILWSAEYTPHGIREYCQVEEEIIASYYGCSSKHDEILDVIFKEQIKKCKVELEFDDLIEEIYQHNTSKIEELAYLYTLDDIKQSGKEIEEFSQDDLDEMLYNNEVSIEECMYYNSQYTEPEIIYQYALQTGVSYVIRPDGAYGCEEYESLTYSEEGIDIELPAIMNSAQQLMFDDLIYEENSNVSLARYGNFYILHDKGYDKYARITNS